MGNLMTPECIARAHGVDCVVDAGRAPPERRHPVQRLRQMLARFAQFFHALHLRNATALTRIDSRIAPRASTGMRGAKSREVM